MGTYRIEKPCVFVQDGKAIRCNRTGTIITIDDRVAADLGDKVTQLGVAIPEEPAEVPLEAVLTTTPETDKSPKPSRRLRPGEDDGPN